MLAPEKMTLSSVDTLAAHYLMGMFMEPLLHIFVLQDSKYLNILICFYCLK